MIEGPQLACGAPAGAVALMAAIDSGDIRLEGVAGELVFTLQPGVGRGRRNALSK